MIRGVILDMFVCGQIMLLCNSLRTKNKSEICNVYLLIYTFKLNMYLYNLFNMLNKLDSCQVISKAS